MTTDPRLERERPSRAWVGLFALMAACGGERATPGPSGEALSSDAAGPRAGGAARELVVHLRTRVEIPPDAELARTLDELAADTEARGGHVERRDLSSDAWATAELRVPAAELDGLVDAIERRGRVTSESEEVVDVSFEHVDLRARLDAAREEERRLLALYADRTASLADVLAVERELARVRADVERLDAEERALADRVRLARVSLEIARASVGLGDDPLGAIATAAAHGVRAAENVALVTAIVGAATLPTAVLLGALALAARELFRWARRLAPRASGSP